MSAACKYRPRCARFVWTFIVSGSLPLNLSDAQSFGVEQGEPERARNDTAIEISHARVQGCEMQGVAFAQMSRVVGEVPGFASKPVMNFKILRVIHRHWPVGRRARRAEIEYFLMYLTGWPSCASTVLSLHFETDTGVPLRQGPGIVLRFLCLRRVVRSCRAVPPTTRELHCSRTFCIPSRSAAMCHICLDEPATLKPLARPFLHCFGGIARPFMAGRSKTGVSGNLLSKKGNLMARRQPLFWKNPFFSGNSGTRAYA